MANSSPDKWAVTTIFLVRLWAPVLVGPGTQLGGPAMAAAAADSGGTAGMLRRYQRLMTKHGRVNKNPRETARRFLVFLNNVEYIDFVNAQNRPYKLEANWLADRTEDESDVFSGGFRRSSHKRSNKSRFGRSSNFRYSGVRNVPMNVDWRKRGAVTSVQNQGDHCGCCWAFSSVAAIEGIIKINGGQLIDQSEQQLVDCDFYYYGCQGGQMRNAFEYVQENHGLTAELTYPYRGLDEPCREPLSSNASILGYEDVPENDEQLLLQTVPNQPVSVAIDAKSRDFRLYSSDIFTGECGVYLNHGIAAVGYGRIGRNGMKYWIVKNSWRTRWGENGYIMMQRNAEEEEGLCGIALSAS